MHSISMEKDTNSSSFIDQALLKAREAFHRNIPKAYDFRLQQLKQLRKCLVENEKEFQQAIKADLNKPPIETQLVEIEFTIKEIDYHLDNLKSYFKPEYISKKGLAFLLNSVKIKYEPFGVCLIFGAWNYPLQLCLCPLAAAIAAGNCAIVKPSELATNFEQFIGKILPKYLDQNCYHVITGGPEDSQRILQERFDLVFFTGSPNIGRLVYQAASKHLTPCIMELGGKCPCYIDDSVNLEMACRRILWGKMINSGQTCVAPDYILCKQEIQEKFIEQCKKTFKEWYNNDFKNSDSYSRIINEKNFDRLVKLIENTNGKIEFGGKYDREQKFIEPTLITNVPTTDSLMKEELFGPIFPIITVDSVDEAIEFIKRGEKPLALYVFSNKKDVINKFEKESSSGSMAINNAVMQICVDELPFGGVGQSGFGNYHGPWSFKTFSHSKAIFVDNFNPLIEKIAELRYPPYTLSKMNKLVIFFRRTFVDNIDPWRFLEVVFTFFFGVTVALLGVFAMDKLK